jgi:hypothetical protein
MGDAELLGEEEEEEVMSEDCLIEWVRELEDGRWKRGRREGRVGWSRSGAVGDRTMLIEEHLVSMTTTLSSMTAAACGDCSNDTATLGLSPPRVSSWPFSHMT